MSQSTKLSTSKGPCGNCGCPLGLPHMYGCPFDPTPHMIDVEISAKREEYALAEEHF